MTGVLQKKVFMAAGILLVMILAVSGCDFIDGTDFLDDDISENGEVELYLSESEEGEAAALNIDSDNTYPDKNLDDIEEVNVVIESILINHKDGEGWQQLDDFDEPQMVDLLDPELSSEPLVESVAAAGEYDMIKLMAAAEYDEEENNEESDADPAEISDKSHVVYADGETENLFIKAAAESGIKVHGDFTVDEGVEQTLTMAFTADDLLVDRGPNKPMLIPAAFHMEAGEPADPEAPRATEVELYGDQDLEAVGESKTGEYTASLNESVETSIVFTLDEFIEEDIESLSEGEVSELLADGVELTADSEEGEAELDIGFAAEVDNKGTLTAAINEDDENVEESDEDSLEITVDTIGD